ncbi:cnvh-domain protein [Fusarium sp. NRRL 52700]|nr:cnvh-domain protein [Fusarium sp. NRRL 52700]
MGFFQSIADAFSKNGAVTKFAEQIPVVGHVTAGIQAIAGNGEEAKRALATSTGNIFSTAGAVGGFVVGGPPGAVAGGALGGLAGTFVESGIAGSINDPSVKGDLGDVTAGKVMTNMGLGGATAMFGGAGNAFKIGSTTLGKEAMKGVVKIGAGNAIGQGIKGLKPGVQTGNSDQTGPKTRRYVSEINKTKSDACAKQMSTMAAKYPAIPVTGPCLNAAGWLQGAIMVGQFLELGTAEFTNALIYFSERWEVAGAHSQGGIDKAVIDLMNKGGMIVENGVNVPKTAEQIKALLEADYVALLNLKSIAAHSFEYEFDEH